MMTVIGQNLSSLDDDSYRTAGFSGGLARDVWPSLSGLCYCVKPASDYKLIPRFRLSRRCRGSCRDFRLPTGTLRLADACD